MVSSVSTIDSARYLEHFRAVRRLTEELCETLEPEDQVIQSMPDVSPTRWHLAHTTWFFETFVLSRDSDYAPVHPAYEFLFNSYYNAVGAQFQRTKRGLLSRPTVAEVYDYRAAVDERMLAKLESGALDEPQVAAIVELGCNHEQQHQELLLMDIKHVFSCNPLDPVYRRRSPSPTAAPPTLAWHEFDDGVFEIGHRGDGFAYDNETPRHRVLLEPYRLADRLVTNAEYEEFIEDGGYRRPELWLSAGFDLIQREGISAPLYWRREARGWHHFGLAGVETLKPSEPVSHVSYFEADAFARWAGARLPSEAEWEVAATTATIRGNFVEDRVFDPLPAPDATGEAPRQMFGDLWEWTQSPYIAYPGFKPAAGAIGEYNGKFMCNQYVLRGGSFATARDHIRTTYRNFFPPEARWAFSGIRLAR